MKGVEVRALEAGDVDRLRRLFFRLSPRTVYLRFFAPIHRPSESMLRYLAAVDHDRREAFAAIVDGEIIGVARYDRAADDPAQAEVAVVVQDDWQGHGVGPMLLDALARAAHRHGVRTFTASVLGENRRVLDMTHHLNPQAQGHLVQGEWALEVPLGRAPVLLPAVAPAARYARTGRVSPRANEPKIATPTIGSTKIAG